MLKAAEELAQVTGMAEACQLLNIPRSTLYRMRQPEDSLPEDSLPEDSLPVGSSQRTKAARALSSAEREEVRNVLNSERFQDQSPRQVYAALLDEEEYLCHWRTMYRVLEEHQEVQERRNQLRHPTYTKPELLATGPNQLWSWDITRMRGPVTWSYYYLYVMLDVFSRYVVAWLLAERESAALAQELVAAAYTTQQHPEGTRPGQLTIHADRGAPMMAKSMAMLMSDLGVNESHSRPHVSDDNPYSEAQFRTVKYRADYPDRFGSLSDARSWCEEFFPWYNNEHHHSALHLLTPADVHYGQAAEKLAQRQAVLQRAYVAHPERFVNGPPTMPQLPAAVWINRPVAADDPVASSASLPIVSVVY
jgi:putative transposase